MPLLTIVAVLIVVGVLLWLINTYIPMQGTIKSILNAVVVIAVVIWLLQIFGLLGTLQNFRVGHWAIVVLRDVQKGPSKSAVER